MNTDNKYNLLDEKLISVRLIDGSPTDLSLTEILLSLSTSDDIVSFSALQPHQQQSWYCFLVQLAAMAAARENGNKLPDTLPRWKEVLLKLSDGSESAWCLVVPDLKQPAFMQTPVIKGSLEDAGYKPGIEGPEDLDILITSKNHDVKAVRMRSPKIQHWIFSLINLQTMEGNFGRGNYGIVRMNGGFGNRPFIGYTKRIGFASRVRRDIEILLLNREAAVENYSDFGYSLLWVVPWDGGKNNGVPIQTCDPWFIEICRRIRFSENENSLESFRANSESKRVEAPEELFGVTGDPWTPIDSEKSKSLTLGDAGFSYELIQKILFKQGYRSPVSMNFKQDEKGGTHLICHGLVRGQGKTGGLHKRIIPVSVKAARALFQDTTLQVKLAKQSSTRVGMAQDAAQKVLRPAVALLQSNANSVKADAPKVQSWINLFNSAIDQRFFDSLWDSVSLDPNEARQQWAEILYMEAEKIYLEAERSVPIAQLRRYGTISAARALFYSRSRSVLEWPPAPELI